MTRLLFVTFLAFAACSSDPPASTPDASTQDAATDTGSSQDGTTSDVATADVTAPDAAGDASSAFVLTSSAFTAGGAIPVTNSCKGLNESPALAWTGAPSTTKSFAFVLTDKTNALVHTAAFDIPAVESALPAAIPKVANPPTPAGMKQVKAYDNATFGYLGPCPPSVHTYEFAIIALDVATLPNVTTASTRTAVVTEIGKHTIATATLTGTFTP